MNKEEIIDYDYDDAARDKSFRVTLWVGFVGDLYRLYFEIKGIIMENIDCFHFLHDYCFNTLNKITKPIKT